MLHVYQTKYFDPNILHLYLTDVDYMNKSNNRINAENSVKNDVQTILSLLQFSAKYDRKE
jgi:hypothetical protein